jgi:hypothetical protein
MAGVVQLDQMDVNNFGIISFVGWHDSIRSSGYGSLTGASLQTKGGF